MKSPALCSLTPYSKPTPSHQPLVQAYPTPSTTHRIYIYPPPPSFLTNYPKYCTQHPTPSLIPTAGITRHPPLSLPLPYYPPTPRPLTSVILVLYFKMYLYVTQTLHIHTYTHSSPSHPFTHSLLF